VSVLSESDVKKTARVPEGLGVYARDILSVQTWSQTAQTEGTSQIAAVESERRQRQGGGPCRTGVTRQGCTFRDLSFNGEIGTTL